MKTACLSAAAAFMLPAHSSAQIGPSATHRALQDEGLYSMTLGGVEEMGHGGSHSSKSGKATTPSLPSVFNQTDNGSYRDLLFNPDDSFPTGEKYDMFVIDPNGEHIGSQRGYSYFYPPYTEGNFIGNSVFTVMGETLTVVGQNDIVAASAGYSEFVGGKVFIEAIQFQPFYLGTVTLELPAY